MLKIKIAIPCKEEGDKILLLKNPRTREDMDQLEKDGVAQIHISANPFNTLTLTQFGNKFIDEAKNDYDYLILMHSDVDLSLFDFVKHLEKVQDKYDLIGLAGTKKLTLSHSPLTWFTGSAIFPDERYGKIIHKINDEYEESFFNFSNPDVKDTEVLTIDGLLMCFNKKLMQSGIRFDEQFTYDFYDLDLCFSIQMQTDMKIGVFAQDGVIHESVGRSVLSPDYLVPERKFRMKWQNLLVQKNQ